MKVSLEHAQDTYFSFLESILVEPWLDLGCGWHLLWPWEPERERMLTSKRMVIGTDLDWLALKKHQTILRRVCADCCALPFQDCSFSLVTANMVVEHLNQPGVALAEVRRITKPGGRFVLHTPHLWGYPAIGARLIPNRFHTRLLRFLGSKRDESDIYPTRYKMSTEASVVRLARRTGWEVESIRLITSVQIFPKGWLRRIEGAWIGLLRLSAFEGLRTNLIAVLRRPGR